MKTLRITLAVLLVTALTSVAVGAEEEAPCACEIYDAGREADLEGMEVLYCECLGEESGGGAYDEYAQEPIPDPEPDGMVALVETLLSQLAQDPIPDPEPDGMIALVESLLSMLAEDPVPAPDPKRMVALVVMFPSLPALELDPGPDPEQGY